jgi:hypothetical protein
MALPDKRRLAKLVSRVARGEVTADDMQKVVRELLSVGLPVAGVEPASNGAPHVLLLVASLSRGSAEVFVKPEADLPPAIDEALDAASGLDFVDQFDASAYQFGAGMRLLAWTAPNDAELANVIERTETARREPHDRRAAPGDLPPTAELRSLRGGAVSVLSTARTSADAKALSVNYRRSIALFDRWTPTAK